MASPAIDPVIVWASWLAVPGLGPRGAAGWLRAHGTITAAVEALRRGDVAGVPPRQVASVRRALGASALQRATDEVATWRAGPDRLVALGTRDYPCALAELSDPPPLLFVRGRLPETLTDATGLPRAVAVVGTRRATPWGRAFARDLGRDLAAADAVVISGLALGIDGEAHRGALEGQRTAGRHGTVAVLAGGLDAIHPPSHQALAERIATHGALVSEHPPGVRPSRGAFPRRNRIIAGLAAAVAVIEAPHRSGVRHTVEVASQAGRDVWVVPRRPDAEIGRAAATLLVEGAAPLTGAPDLLATLPGAAEGPNEQSGRASPSWPATDDPVERAILEHLVRHGASGVDAVSACGATVLASLAALGRLEARGVVATDASGRWRLRGGMALPAHGVEG